MTHLPVWIIHAIIGTPGTGVALTAGILQAHR
jgi:hypothetical protein